MTETSGARPPSQLSPHRAVRTELPGRYGPVAALRTIPGANDLGVTALLVPGFMGSKEDFAPLLDPIGDTGIEAVAIDLPGQYESPGPDDEAEFLPDPLGVQVADLVGKLAAEGRRVLLLGHSYGGLVARAAVLAGAPIAGLTLLDSGPGELPPGYRRMALDFAEPALREHGITAALKLREQMDAATPEWALISDELKEFLAERFVRTSVPSLLGMGDGLRREPDRVAKLARALRKLDVPAFVVCGEGDDAWTVASQRDMAERLDADFAVVPGAKHSPNTQNPDGLLATLLPTWRAWLAGP